MDNQFLDNIRVATSEAIKKAKRKIPMYTGISLENKQFETGRITVLRRSLQDIYEHMVEDENINRWLQTFDIRSLSKMKYRGWAPNRPYPKDHPKYDPANPLVAKHKSDTKYFLYYTIKIEKRDYWANVKMHKHYGEVLYTIKKEKPEDLIKGHKKSDIENVYSSAYGWRD